MAKVSFKEASKVNWIATLDNENAYPGAERLQLGCLMRIADATEKSAQNTTILMNNRDYYKDMYERQRRQCIALKGQITRLKKQLENPNN